MRDLSAPIVSKYGFGERHGPNESERALTSKQGGQRHGLPEHRLLDDRLGEAQREIEARRGTARDRDEQRLRRP